MHLYWESGHHLENMPHLCVLSHGMEDVTGKALMVPCRNGSMEICLAAEKFLNGSIPLKFYSVFFILTKNVLEKIY